MTLHPLPCFGAATTRPPQEFTSLAPITRDIKVLNSSDKLFTGVFATFLAPLFTYRNGISYL